MTYGVDLLRSVYYYGKPEYAKTVLFNPAIDIGVCLIAGLIFLFVGTYVFVKKERDR
jgi:ABC-type multidrug transport system permease subunit